MGDRVWRPLEHQRGPRRVPAAGLRGGHRGPGERPLWGRCGQHPPGWRALPGKRDHARPVPPPGSVRPQLRPPWGRRGHLLRYSWLPPDTTGATALGVEEGALEVNVRKLGSRRGPPNLCLRSVLNTGFAEASGSFLASLNLLTYPMLEAAFTILL